MTATLKLLPAVVRRKPTSIIGHIKHILLIVVCRIFKFFNIILYYVNVVVGVYIHLTGRTLNFTTLVIQVSSLLQPRHGRREYEAGHAADV